MNPKLPHLKIGQQLWFWLSKKIPPNGPLLYLSPMNKDPDMQKLANRVLRSHDSNDGISGTAIVGSNRRLTFSAQSVTEEALTNVAKWLQDNATAEGWNQLAGSRFLNINEYGVVTAVFEDDSLWKGSDIPAQPGQPKALARALEAMKVDESSWFWFGGSTENAYVIVSPINKDPKTAKFVRSILAIDYPFSLDNFNIRGVLRKLKNGWLLTTTNKPSSWCGHLNNWLIHGAKEHPSLSSLVNFKVAVQNNNKLESILSLDSDDTQDVMQQGLKQQQKTFETLTTGEELLFWFGETPKGALCLASDAQTLKTRAKPFFPLSKNTIRGKVKYTPKGFPIFKSKQKFDNFLPLLAKWFRLHRSEFPFIGSINRARFVLLDGNGSALKREKNDHLWR